MKNEDRLYTASLSLREWIALAEYICPILDSMPAPEICDRTLDGLNQIGLAISVANMVAKVDDNPNPPLGITMPNILWLHINEQIFMRRTIPPVEWITITNQFAEQEDRIDKAEMN